MRTKQKLLYIALGALLVLRQLLRDHPTSPRRVRVRQPGRRHEILATRRDPKDWARHTQPLESGKPQPLHPARGLPEIVSLADEDDFLYQGFRPVPRVWGFFYLQHSKSHNQPHRLSIRGPTDEFSRSASTSLCF